MNLLQRHLFLSTLTAALAAVGIFIFLLLSGEAMRDIFGYLGTGRISPADAGQLMLLLLPYMFSYCLPLGLLTAVMLVLGRMSASGEVVAMRTAGLSLARIAAPFIFAALLGTTIAGIINNYYAPAARATYRTLLAELVRDNPVAFLQPRTFIREFPGYVLYATEAEGNTLRGFWIWELDEKDRPIRLLRAEEGEFAYDETRAALVLTLRNATAEIRDAADPDNLASVHPVVSFAALPISLPLEHLFGPQSQPRRISYFTLPQIREEMARLRALNEPPDPDARITLPALELQLQKNFAMAFSSLCLILVGIPLAVRVGRREAYANVGLAVTLAMAYYVLTIVASWFENQPHLHPELIVWIPNLLAQGLGLTLLYKAERR